MVYIAPLIPRPGLILSAPIIFLIIAGMVMMLSQPPFSIGESRTYNNSDKRSIILIFWLGLVSYLIPVIDWAYLHQDTSNIWTPYAVAGIIMITGGLRLRIWAIRTLGSFFTATVQIAPNQRIVTTGPFAVVRHPSYLGAWLAIIGSASLLNSLIGILVAAFLMSIAYIYRIAAEEKTLIDEFGGDYLAYKKCVAAFIPLGKQLSRACSILD